MTSAKSSQPIDPARLPRHIAIIMDGNGRWARRRMLPRVAGHREGVRAVDRVVTRCRELGVQALTLYSFSSENWRRPREEISALWGLLAEYLERELGRMLREGIRFNTIGHIQDLPEFAQGIVQRAKETTRNERDMVLTLALSYGSRQELVDACRRIAREVRAGRLEPEEVNAQVLEQYLETAGLPPVDLLIRTSGEQRLSNYLLWQLAYAELYFTETLWPDFREEHLEEAVHAYRSRIRKFGMTEEQLAARKG